MRLEDAIQQRVFRSEHEKSIVNIMYSYFWIKERMGKVLSDYGITSQQYNVLRILKGQHPGGITTSDIRERMLDKMSDASRLVDRLTKLELVEKKINTNDRRLVIVTVTEKGLELIGRIDMQQGPTGEISSNLNEEEVTMLNTLLDKLRG